MGMISYEVTKRNIDGDPLEVLYKGSPEDIKQWEENRDFRRMEKDCGNLYSLNIDDNKLFKQFINEIRWGFIDYPNPPTGEQLYKNWEQYKNKNKGE